MNIKVATDLLLECESRLVDAIYYADMAAARNERQQNIAASGHRDIANRFRDLRKRIRSTLDYSEAA